MTFHSIRSSVNFVRVQISVRHLIMIPFGGIGVMYLDGLQHLPNETGGILMGRWNSPREASVQAVIGPGPNAKHEQRRFTPDHEWQKREVARLYERFDRTLEYLGDWHTHPNGRPTPSRRDLQTARLIRDHPRARVSKPLMLICGVGTQGSLRPVLYVLQKKLQRCRIEPVAGQVELAF